MIAVLRGLHGLNDNYRNRSGLHGVAAVVDTKWLNGLNGLNGLVVHYELCKALNCIDLELTLSTSIIRNNSHILQAIFGGITTYIIPTAQPQCIFKPNNTKDGSFGKTTGSSLFSNSKLPNQFSDETH